MMMAYSRISYKTTTHEKTGIFVLWLGVWVPYVTVQSGITHSDDDLVKVVRNSYEDPEGKRSCMNQAWWRIGLSVALVCMLIPWFVAVYSHWRWRPLWLEHSVVVLFLIGQVSHTRIRTLACACALFHAHSKIFTYVHIGATRGPILCGPSNCISEIPFYRGGRSQKAPGSMVIIQSVILTLTLNLPQH